MLCVFLFVLIEQFLNKFVEARKQITELIQQKVSANFIDRTMHHFGNLLMPPKTTLNELSSLFENPAKLTALVKDANKANIWKTRIKIASDSLDDAQNKTDEFKIKAKTEGRAWENLKTMLEQAKKIIQAEKGFKKACMLRCSNNIELKINKEMFNEVMINILDNAMSAIRSHKNEKPNIGIVVIEQTDDSLLLQIKDNGSGIEEKYRDQIFDPYFSTKGSGSGLGLVIAKEFMRSMDGTITYETHTEGKQRETVFTLRFPGRFMRTRRKK